MVHVHVMATLACLFGVILYLSIRNCLGEVALLSHSKISLWWYRLVGPTTRYLQVEMCLWAVLMLLSVSNLQGIYRESFGTPGDCMYLLLSALWCGKYIIWRWIACWDPSTTQSPTFRGLLAHIYTTHLMGGQIYDRPLPKQIARFLGMKDDSVPLLNSSQSSFVYASRLWRRRGGRYANQAFTCLQKWTEKLASPRNSSATKISAASKATTKPRSKFGFLLKNYHRQWQMIRQNAPSTQFLIYCLGLFAIKSLVRHRIMHYYQKEPTSTYLYSASLGVTVKQEQTLMQQEGDYKRREMAQSWWEDAWSTPVLVLMGLCMWIFARVIPPLPDLVAGSHPMKDIRSDKMSASSGGGSNNHNNVNSGTNVSRGSNSSSSSGFWARLSALGFASPTTLGWSETQAPIATAPRLYVHTAMFILRIIDIAWVVLWLPRTDSVCQLTGHCTSPWSVDERAFYLYPVGVTGQASRSSRPSEYWPNQVHDTGSFITVLLNLMTLAPFLLWTQALLSNRTYWASWGSYAGEWMVVESWDGRGTTSTWEARRKYKMDDEVVHRGRKFIATVSQPNGRPYVGIQRYMQMLLAGETGDPAASAIVRRLAGIQLLCFFVHFLFWYSLHLRSIRYDGLFSALLANGLGTYFLSVVGLTRPASTLGKINKEATGA